MIYVSEFKSTIFSSKNMTNHFKTSWGNKLRNNKMPSRFTGVDIIYYEDFEKNLRELDVNYADKIVETLISGKVIILKQSFEASFIKKLKNKCIDFWNNNPDTYHEMKEGCPDFHRIITPELAKGYSLGAVRHSTYFFPWNNNLNDFWPEIYSKWRKLKFVAGLDENAFEKNTPLDKAIDRPQIVCYPPNFGGVETHVDTDSNCNLAFSCYMSSKSNNHFNSGGFYVQDKKNKSINLENFIDAGDVGVYCPTIQHGVSPIDLDVDILNYNWNSGEGRWWMGLFTPDSNEVVVRKTSTSFGSGFIKN